MHSNIIQMPRMKSISSHTDTSSSICSMIAACALALMARSVSLPCPPLYLSVGPQTSWSVSLPRPPLSTSQQQWSCLSLKVGPQTSWSVSLPRPPCLEPLLHVSCLSPESLPAFIPALASSSPLPHCPLCACRRSSDPAPLPPSARKNPRSLRFPALWRIA